MYHYDFTKINERNIEQVITNGFIEKSPTPSLSIEERIARVLEFWQSH